MYKFNTGLSIKGRNIIHYCANQVSPRDGAWDMRHREFLNGVEINEWAVAVCNNYFSRQSHLPSEEDIRSA